MKGLQEKLDKVEAPSATQFGMLQQLNFGYNQYAGTVPYEEVRRRRAKGKVQKQSKRINRKKK